MVSSRKHLIRKSVIATLSVAMISGLAFFTSSAAWAAKPFPLPPMLHFTPIAPNTPVIQVKPMAPWHANQLLDPDSPGGPAWGGLFDVEALGMSQNNPTSPQPGCDYWPSRAQSIAWWESQPTNQALSNLQKYTYGTLQHFQWIVGTEYSHQDAMGWQYAACPPPPAASGGGLSLPGGGKSYKTPYGNTINSNGTVTLSNGKAVSGTIDGNAITFTNSNGTIVTDTFTSGGYTTANSAGQSAALSNSGNLVANGYGAITGLTNNGTIKVQTVAQNSTATQTALNTAKNAGGTVGDTTGSGSTFASNLNASVLGSGSGSGFNSGFNRGSNNAAW